MKFQGLLIAVAGAAICLAGVFLGHLSRPIGVTLFLIGLCAVLFGFGVHISEFVERLRKK